VWRAFAKLVMVFSLLATRRRVMPSSLQEACQLGKIVCFQ
jgi:hypothetical protein